MAKPLILILLVFAAVGISCSSGDKDISLNQDGTNNLNAVLVDTMRVDGYTVLTDSSNSSATGNLLVGSVELTNTLKAQAESYFSVGLPSSTFGSLNITKELVLDSAQLHLTYSDYIGDTTQIQHIQLHELLEEIPLNETHSSRTTFKYDSDPLDELAIRQRPYKDTSITFDIPIDMAQRIFAYYKGLSSADTKDLTKIIKGFVMTGDSSNTSVIGYTSSNSTLRIYTHTVETYDKYSFDFNILQNNAQFNHLSYNSEFDGLNGLEDPKDQVSSKLTNNMFALNNGLALAGKIEIPGIRDLQILTSLKGIYRVELRLYSTRKSAKALPYPPSGLQLYEVNLNNQITQPVTDFTGASVTGAYTYDPTQLIFNSYYAFNLTQYFKNIVSGSSKNKGILIVPTNTDTNSSQLSGVWLGDFDNPSFRPEIRVYLNR